jgi:3'(2'), 5'-bisphosphate nucleotidase
VDALSEGTEQAALLERVVAVAEQAAREILRVYDRPVVATGKADGSPLTAADIAANEAISLGLRAFSEFPVVSEESPRVHHTESACWPAYWLVDPLDGTREFIDRNGEFTVNIALIRSGRPVLGVVSAPALGLTYQAASGRGAFLAGWDAPPRAIRTCVGTGAMRVAVSRSHGGDALPGFLAGLGHAQPVPMGSSLKICLVAEGKADLYPRLGPTSEWDIAAAHCILTEAGGLLTDVFGKPIRYNKEDIINPWFLAAASTDVHSKALAAMRLMGSNAG